MSDFKLEIDMDDLLRQFGDLAGIDTDSALMAGGLVVEGAGKENIVRYDFIDTGATLNSVEARQEGDEVQVGPETEYAIFGELGIGQSEKPFMRDALRDSQGEIAQAVAEALRDQLRRIIR